MDKKEKAFFERLVATFKIEAEEHVVAISSGLLELEKAQPQRAAVIIETVFREAHSMKGAARAVNRDDIELLCQKLESVFAVFKNKRSAPSRETLNVLHPVVDSLGKLAESARQSSEKAAFMDLSRKLDGLIKEFELEPGPGRTEAQSIHRDTITDLPAKPASAAETVEVDSGKPVTARTVKIEKVKLDSLLLKAEGLLSAKPAMGQRCVDLEAVTGDIALLRKGWARVRDDLHKPRKFKEREAGLGAGLKDNGGREGDHAGLLEFITTNEDRMKSLHTELTALAKSMEQDKRSLSAMLDELLNEAKNAAMSPFSSLLDQFPKLVRDLSHSQGKEAELVVRGGEIEIDRRILEELKDPLVHMTTNCIDHGIEKPEKRESKGQKRTGTITIAVSHASGKGVAISIRDDGSGVDLSRIRESAARAGILTEAEAGSLDEARILQLIFHSGITASPLITTISGRGLGLAIVKEKVEKLRGTVSCESSPGSGTVFTIVLPLSLAAFRGVLVRSSQRLFILPTAYLDRAVRIKADGIKTVGNIKTILYDVRAIPLVPLGDLLDLQRKPQKETKKEFLQALVLISSGEYLAVGVDEIVGEQEVTEKGLGSHLRRVRNVAGSTILGTGKVVPILSVPDLMKSAAKIFSAAVSPVPGQETIIERKSILVVEDSITSRTLLKNILETAGYEARTAVDGADAMATLKTGEFDLVVSDVSMPKLNGFDLTSKIRADKKLSQLPVVLVTALESSEDRERGIDVGANAYIVKSSFDQSDLIEVIGRLI